MKTYRWGIIGLGHIAGKFAEGLREAPQAVLYAVASRQQDKADAFAARYGALKAYGTYDALVADPNVDVVYIATPHNLHLENAIMCLEARKPVLCEKPLAVNLSQLDELTACAAHNRTFLMEALWTRFLPKIDKALELLATHKIGQVSYLRADFGFSAPRNPAGRLFNPNLAGGSLLDVGIYTVFYALLFLGYPDKISAQARIGTTGIDEHCAMTLEYKNGCLAQLFSSIVAETPMTAEIAGSTAHLTIEKPLYAPSNLHINNKEGRFEPFAFEHSGNGYHFEALEVMQCLENGRIQSEKLSWAFSRQIMQILDTVRSIIGLRYPFE